MHLRKDRSLDRLARVGNVAQFVAFEPTGGDPSQTFLRVSGRPPNQHYGTPHEAVAELLRNAVDGTVNIRSYAPEDPRSREFLYGLSSLDAAMSELRRLSGEGLHTIVNETIDMADGGVSGVVQGGVVEFAPDDTPRCVEKPGVASLPIGLGLKLLEAVYGFRPEFGDAEGRIEFSIHPRPRGWMGTRTLLWEHEEQAAGVADAGLTWPNRFSRHLGDKAYGLLMAHLVGMPVPHTLAVPRRIAPFRFGCKPDADETWIRTCPIEQEPGLFTTHRGWLDPFRLMSAEDPEGVLIASVLSQDGVRAVWSGASVVDAGGETVVEGVFGVGDAFMLGEREREPLPIGIVADVVAASESLRRTFGPVRMEWAHDGAKVWILQLHRGATTSTSRTLVPGERRKWVDFDVAQGLDNLRMRLNDLDAENGLLLLGDVGMTSHIADLVRKSGVPTRIAGTGPISER